MKPRTKLEKRVTGLSGKLSAVTEVQKEWAKEHIFTHEAYRCKDELWCSECGGTWIDTSWAKNTGSDAKDRHQISELAHDNVIRAFIDKGYSVEYRSEIAAGRYVIIRG